MSVRLLFALFSSSIDGSGWFRGEFQLGWNTIVSAFLKETKPLALNAFSKSRFVLALLLEKVNITTHPKSAHPRLCIPFRRGFQVASHSLITRN